MGGRRPGRCLIACLLLLSAGLEALLCAPAPQTRVRATPGHGQVRPGQTITVEVQIRGALDVGSVPFTLVYDPAILEPISGLAAEGPFLRRDGSSTAFMARVSPSASGLLTVGLSRLRSDRGAGGKGTLCRLKFKALREGTSALEFVRAAVLDPRAQPLAASFENGSIQVKAKP